MFRFRLLVFCAAVVIIAFALSACPGAAFAHDLATPSASSSTSQGLWVTSSYFVSEFQGSTLAHSGIPPRALNTGISRVGTTGKVAFDAKGDAWLPLCGLGPDTEFPGGLVIELTPSALSGIAAGQLAGVKVKATLADSSFSCPQGLAFDPSGGLWIASDGGYHRGPPAITGYRAAQLSQKNPAASVVIDSSSFSDLGGITFDASGNLWVADSNSNVLEFSAQQLSSGGSLSPNLIVQSDYHPFDLVFNSSGDLWVSYPPSYGMPIGAGGLELFAANDLTGSGMITPTPLVTITPVLPCSPFSICNVHGEALDSAGDLWVSSFENIYEFTPAQIGSSGSPMPHLVWASDGFKFHGRTENFGGPSFLTFGPTVK